ncbi:hypothetical protein [Streptomyces sp. NPDC126499]|uniref:hypothetical protein n=1 Tax=Streptomyces sp. NPDC126499 TaxID=3155314 RepID=UPI00332258E9
MNKQGPEMRHTETAETTETTGATGQAGATEKAGTAEKAEGKRFDLSVPQVAGSALAAVIAAKLASTLGVYGTIVGAGVISVIATCGGPVLQHLLKRTGEQVRVVKVALPKGRQAPGPYGSATGREGSGRSGGGSEFSGEFGEPTTHGTRVRGWKRPAVGAAVVFLLAMGGITAYELTSGQDLGGTRGTTTFGSVVSGQGDGGDGGGRDEERPAGGGTPAATPSAGTGQGGQRDRGDQGERTGGGDVPSPGTTPGTGSATPGTAPTPKPTPTPTPTPSGSTEPTDGGGTTSPAAPPAATPEGSRGAAAE